MKYEREKVYWVKHTTIDSIDTYRCTTRKECERMKKLCMEDELTVCIEVEEKEYIWRRG